MKESSLEIGVDLVVSFGDKKMKSEGAYTDVIGLSTKQRKKLAFGYFDDYGLEIDEETLDNFCKEKNCSENKKEIRDMLEKYKFRYERKFFTYDGYLEACSVCKTFEELEELLEDFSFFIDTEKIVSQFKKDIYKIGVPNVVIENIPIITTIENDSIFVYNGEGIWLQGEHKINELLEKQNKDYTAKIKFTHAQKQEVLSQLKHQTYRPITSFDNNPAYLLPLRNGILDLRTSELREYRYDDYFTKKLNVDYNKDAKAERFEQFLDEICLGSGETVEEKEENRQKMITGLKELIGYCLWKDYPIQKMFFLIGGGSNGKGVFLTVLQKMFGIENVSSISIKNLSEDKFAGAELFSRYVNLSSELTGGELKNMDFIKALTGGDLITAQKKFEHPFKFVNYAKLMIASNHPPKVGDASVGFYRRVHIYDFAKTFLGSKADKTLTKQLTYDSSLSGVLNIGISYLKQWLDESGEFRADADFTNSLGVEEIRSMYELRSDPISAYVFDCVEPSIDDDAYETKEAVYNYYLDYCKNRALPHVSQVMFSREFKMKARFVSEYRKSDRQTESRERCWYGLHINVEKVKKSNYATNETQQTSL